MIYNVYSFPAILQSRFQENISGGIRGGGDTGLVKSDKLAIKTSFEDWQHVL
jgi:hypothetical protein